VRLNERERFAGVGLAGLCAFDNQRAVSIEGLDIAGGLGKGGRSEREVAEERAAMHRRLLLSL
jgi:hypothetical protein